MPAILLSILLPSALSSPATRIQTYILSRYATTLALQEEKHFWVVFADFHGINTPTMTGFKLLL